MSRDSFVLLYINILKLFYYLTGMSIAATRFDNRIENVVSVGVGHAAFKNTALYFQLYGEHSWFNIFCYHFALSAAADGPSESFLSSSEQSDRVSVYACATLPLPSEGAGGRFQTSNNTSPSVG